MTSLDNRYVAYSDAIEVPQAEEAEISAKILASMSRVNQNVFDRHRHAKRDAHAKGHGVLKGTLEVYRDLPVELAQGLFATAGKYDVVVRLSTAPGDIHSDTVPAPRGFAMKVLGVAGVGSQDFLLVNHPTIPFGDVAAYLRVQEVVEKTDGGPELAQRAVAALARGADQALHAVGIESPPLLEALATSNTNILGETFYSMAALRYGSYVAKVCVAPFSESVKRLKGEAIGDQHSALRDLVSEFFHGGGAEYELRVQLCTDLGKMPVEDAAVEWPEELSPYLAVGRVVFGAQETDSPARRVYADEVLSFNPWHCLPEHRPLGSIMRIRKAAYEASTAFRHEMNQQERVEPKEIGQIPD